jgi:hypothetical protein
VTTLDNLQLPFEFGCWYCAGTGYLDYPMNKRPCPVQGHAEAHQSNVNAISTYMKANPNPYRPEIEGACPYCGEKVECVHWTGWGWSRDKKELEVAEKSIKQKVNEAIDPTDPNAMLNALEESVEVLNTVISAMNSGPAYWGDAFDRDDFERIKAFTIKFDMGWFDPE